MLDSNWLPSMQWHQSRGLRTLAELLFLVGTPVAAEIGYTLYMFGPTPHACGQTVDMDLNDTFQKFGQW